MLLDQEWKYELAKLVLEPERSTNFYNVHTYRPEALDRADEMNEKYEGGNYRWRVYRYRVEVPQPAEREKTPLSQGTRTAGHYTVSWLPSLLPSRCSCSS